MLRISYLLLFLPALLAMLTCDAQTPFRREIDLPGDLSLHDSHTNTLDGGSIHFIVSFPSPSGNARLSVVKLSATGAVQWTRRLNGSTLSVTEIVQAADSSYYLCYADEISQVTYRAVHLDPSGNVIYSRQLDVAQPYVFAGTPNIVVRGNGCCYIIGDVVDQNALTGMEYVMYLDAPGNLLWSHGYNIQPGKYYHKDVDTCSNGDLLVLGYCYLSVSQCAPMITRITPGGAMLWSRYYPLAGYQLFPGAIVRMPGDDIAISSYGLNLSTFLNESVVMRCDGQGNVLWSFLFSAAGASLRMENTILTENSTLLSLATTADGTVMLKNDSTGLLLCERYYPDLSLKSADVRSSTHYSFSGLNSVNGFGHAVYLTTDGCGVTCMDSVYTIQQIPLNIIPDTITGDSVAPVTNVTFAALNTPPTVEMEDVCGVTGLEENLPGGFSAYPNPCTGTLYIRNAEAFETVQLYDVNGKLLLNRNVTASNMEIDVSALPPGVYTVRLQSDVQAAARRIVVTAQQ